MSLKLGWLHEDDWLMQLFLNERAAQSSSFLASTQVSQLNSRL
jgi:hypothetical protein